MSRIVALLLAAVALVAAGCGGSSEEDYEGEIDQIGQTLDEQFTEIGRDIQASGGLRRAAPEVEKGADALDEAVADLKEIDPPDDAEAAHDKIVRGVGLLAEDFREAGRAAGANDAPRVLRLFGDIESSEGFRMIVEARDELRDAGYDVEE
jgi:hypothetical protein